MKLSELLRGVAIEEVKGEPAGLFGSAALDVVIREIRDDSRTVEPGDLFIALPGKTMDGHSFVAMAKQRGAVAVLVERLLPISEAPLQIRVASTARALAEVAANYYGRPADALTLIAVTGTNGKTTTTHLVEAMLEEAGIPTGLLGTIAYRFRDKSWPAPLTTPTALLFHKTLAEMRKLGASAVALEASSHALALDRLHGVRFRVAALTNLTQDHLDFHGDMEQYFLAKMRLFHEPLLPAARHGRAVVPLDDSYGRRLAAMLPAAQRLTVSLSGEADITVHSEQMTIDGISALLRTPIGEVALASRLSGRFNLSNLVLAAGIGVALGLAPDVIGRGLSRITGVPGRLERVFGLRGPAAPAVFVDYAHTPDALARSIAALRALQGSAPSAKKGRLFVVFGCGGDRDNGKRAAMGKVASHDADLVIVTSDNPRTEDPQRIVDMILEGVSSELENGRTASPKLERAALATAATGYFVELDRRQAIYAAIAAARPEDVVLIAGKGHEDYQIVGRSRLPFEDKEEAHKALLQRVDGPPRSSSPISISSANLTPVAAIAATIELPLDRVLTSTGGKLVRGGAHKFTAVTIDSRAVVPGALFVAVRGQNHDGHKFCAQAIAAGAAGLLVDRGRAPRLLDSTAVAVIEVGDTHVALGQLARAHREAPEIAGKLRVVAITGSSGKTSTKDLLAAILTANATDPAEVLKTEGNLNNHFGVPLTLLRLRPGQRFAVIELGMSARGEIAYLTSLSRPDIGIITNVGPAHLQTLQNLDNVAAAKGELFVGLPDGAAAVYLDGLEHFRIKAQAVLAGAAKKSGRLRALPVFCEGTSKADFGRAEPETSAAGAYLSYRLLSLHEDGLEMALRGAAANQAAGVADGEVSAKVPLLGAHQAANAALAAAAALALDVPLCTIAQGLGLVSPGKHRGQLLLLGGRRILDDCYNANPASMMAALRTLGTLRGTAGAVAVLGDMLELGPDENALHAQVGVASADCALSLLIAVGARAAHIAAAAAERGVATLHVDSAEAAAQAVAKATAAGDWVLIKGSRGMALETVLDHLRVKFEAASPTEAR